MLMTSCFVCATLNLGLKKSTGTEPKQRHTMKRLKLSFGKLYGRYGDLIK